MTRRTIILSLYGEEKERIFRNVPCSPSATVLNVLEYIRMHRYKDLVYRYSCHHGSCGTCGLEVNDKRVLACLTRIVDLEDPIRICPLSGFPKIGGLAVDLHPLFRHFPTQARNLTTHDTAGKAPEEIAKFTKFESCIECGLCESGCPVISKFMGPAALAAHWRELHNNPSRRNEILEFTAKAHGAGACERHYVCTRVCPMGVNPGKAIWNLNQLIQKELNP